MMERHSDRLVDEPSIKKVKLEFESFDVTEAHMKQEGLFSQDVPSSSFQASMLQDCSAKNLMMLDMDPNEHFQSANEFASDPDLERFTGFNREDDFDDSTNDNDDDDDDSDSLLSEIDALLDEGLPEMYNKEPKRKRGTADAISSRDQDQVLPEGVVGVRTKTILRRRGQTPLEGLPDGWISIIHECGMPLYLHRPSRVCTWSRPYLLGAGSARKHRPPLASIPCLHYKKEKEKEMASEQRNLEGVSTNDNQQGAQRIVTETPAQGQTDGAKNSADGLKKHDPLQGHNIHICKDESVDENEMKEYLEKVFDFEVVSINKFKTWADRRKYTKEIKAKQETLNRPQFPGHPAVITCKIPGSHKEGKKEFVLNTTNKTPVCILHEYAQIVLKTQPTYTFDDSGNANCPFQAYVVIHKTKYGKGQAKSKKEAKMAAARATLEILIPGVVLNDAQQKTGKDQDSDQLEYFDHVSITDSRVYDLCTKSGQLTPFQVLAEYRQRNHGMEAMNFSYEVQITNHHKREYKMILGEHTVTGFCKNKKVGKQLGAQQLLRILHPHVDNWGGIIKIYGKGTVSRNMKKKEAEQSIIRLQAKCENAPNEAILRKLREEMIAFYDKQEGEGEAKSGPSGLDQAPEEVDVLQTPHQLADEGPR